MIANELFDKMDLNRDDKVTFEEFTTVAQTDPLILDILNPKAWTINKKLTNILASYIQFKLTDHKYTHHAITFESNYSAVVEQTFNFRGGVGEGAMFFCKTISVAKCHGWKQIGNERCKKQNSDPAVLILVLFEETKEIVHVQ